MNKRIFIFSSGEFKRKENTVILVSENKRKYIPIENIEEVYIFGRISLNSSFLDFIGKNGVVLHFFDYYGWYSGSFIPKEHMLSGEVVAQQGVHSMDKGKRMELAKEFVKGALYNLSRIAVKKDVEVSNRIKSYLPIIDECKEIDELMGIEANGRKAFFSNFEKWTGWEFGKRSRRPPLNPANALISFLNSLVYCEVLKYILQTPLHPGISFLHELYQRRYSLSLDVSEVFKPILADKLAISLINNRIVDNTLFKEFNGGVYLSDAGRRVVGNEFDIELSSTIKYRKLKRKVSVGQLILLELYNLIKHLIGDKIYRSLRVWW